MATVRADAAIHEVPDRVDLAVVAVPALIVWRVAEECADAGVRVLVVLSAGFAETGAEGRQLQQLISVRCPADPSKSVPSRRSRSLRAFISGAPREECPRVDVKPGRNLVPDRSGHSPCRAAAPAD